MKHVDQAKNKTVMQPELHCHLNWRSIEILESSVAETEVKYRFGIVTFNRQLKKNLNRHYSYWVLSTNADNDKQLKQLWWKIVSRPGQSQGLLYKHRCC